MIRKPKLIISGILYPGGGLSTVFKYLVLHLRDSFELTCIGFTPMQETDIIEAEIHGCKLFSIKLVGNHFFFDPAFLENLINSFKPSHFLFLGPLPLNRVLIEQLTPYKKIGLNICGYIPIEGRIVNSNYLKMLSSIDLCIFYTHSAQDYVMQLIEKTAYAGDLPQFQVIGHGIDKKLFHPIANTPLECRKIARKIIYPNHEISESSFVVLNINRPYYRKRLDITIEGFEQFSRDKKDVFLHLHLGLVSSNDIQEIHDLVNKTGLSDKIIITPDLTNLTIKTESWLNNLYNACDVGLTTAMGEGWGLGLFEHALTKTAILAPNHTSFRENWTGAALLMECTDTQYVFYEYSDMDIVVPGEVKKGLDQLFYNDILLEKTAIDCFEKLQSHQLDWKTVAQSFTTSLLDVLKTEEIDSHL
tara:strand:+ start:1634 stop:2884 length:1251 start_codon:yes stop_codon:yes gene_type:complete